MKIKMLLRSLRMNSVFHSYWLFLLFSFAVSVTLEDENLFDNSKHRGYKFSTARKQDVIQHREKRSFDPNPNCSMESCRFPRTLCRCDDDCVLFGDCCSDATVQENQNTTKDMYVCREVNKNFNSWMIADCPKTFTNGRVIEKCRKFAVDSGDPYQMIPVHSISRRMFFQNRYCAICHDIDMSRDLSNLTTTISGFQRGCFILPSPDKRHFLLNILTNEKCSIDLGFLNEYSIRVCGIEFVDTCSDNFLSGSSHENNCKNGPYAPVFDFTRTFRNMHCVLCNTRDTNFLYCGIYKPPLLRADMDLQISFINDDIDGNTTRTEEMEGCKSSRPFDSTTMKCRPLFCGPFHVYKDGRCKTMITLLKNVDMDVSFTIQIQPKIPSMNLHLPYIKEYVANTFPTYFCSVETNLLEYNLQESIKYCTTITLKIVAIFTLSVASPFIALKKIQDHVFTGKGDFRYQTQDGQYYSIRHLGINGTAFCPLIDQSMLANTKPVVSLRRNNLLESPCPQILINNDEIIFLRKHHNHIISKLSNYRNSTEMYMCIEDFKFVVESLEEPKSGSWRLRLENLCLTVQYTVMAISLHVTLGEI